MAEIDFVSDDEEQYIEFPILFNKEKGKKWKIWVDGNKIYRTDCLSYKDFPKKPTCREVQAKAHTTAEEQALQDAKKFWTKKLDDAFEPDPEDKEGQKMYNEIMENKKKQGGNNHGVARSKGGLTKKMNGVVIGVTNKHTAMLAHKFNEKKERILWDFTNRNHMLDRLMRLTKNKYKNLKAPELERLASERLAREYFDASSGAFVQPKLDGVRCLAFLYEGEVVCFTRNAKQFVHLLKQREDIKRFLSKSPNTILDGEWYVHEPVVDGKLLQNNERFDFITSACKTARTSPHEYEHLIEYHVFDVVEPKKNQLDRLQILQKLFENNEKCCVKPVEIHAIERESEIYEWHDKFFQKDYEGIILRNTNAFYEGKRVLHLLKYKEFDDAEFTIVGAEQAQGSQEGAVTWICENDEGKKFRCDMKATIEKRREMYENYADYLGEQLTVRYQGLTKDGVPRFPKGLAIRNYE